jgi:hypothetical protein
MSELLRSPRLGSSDRERRQSRICGLTTEPPPPPAIFSHPRACRLTAVTLLSATDNLESTGQADEASSLHPSTARSCIESFGLTAKTSAENAIPFLSEPWLRRKLLRRGGHHEYRTHKTRAQGQQADHCAPSGFERGPQAFTDGGVASRASRGLRAAGRAGQRRRWGREPAQPEKWSPE